MASAMRWPLQGRKDTGGALEVCVSWGQPPLPISPTVGLVWHRPRSRSHDIKAIQRATLAVKGQEAAEARPRTIH